MSCKHEFEALAIDCICIGISYCHFCGKTNKEIDLEAQLAKREAYWEQHYRMLAKATSEQLAVANGEIEKLSREIAELRRGEGREE